MYSFPKNERLCAKHLIDRLFLGAGSRAVAAFPVRAVWMTVPQEEGAAKVQVLMSVPKKRLRHAVDRNRVKRQLREQWRLLSAPLKQAVPADKQLIIALIWLADRVYSSKAVANRVERVVNKVGTDILKQGELVLSQADNALAQCALVEEESAPTGVQTPAP